jgi:hypothetical protein
MHRQKTSCGQRPRHQAGFGYRHLWVRVNDGAQWSNWSTSFTVTASANTTPDTAPAVSVVNVTATHGQSFAAANLFAAHDAENNPLTRFGFWNSGTGGGLHALRHQARHLG